MRRFGVVRVGMWRSGVLALGCGITLAVIGFVFGPIARAASVQPNGKSNNGDVKVQDAGDADFPPENDPHVDCPFDLAFFNFDAGQQLIASLFAQPPSGDTTQQVWGPTTVIVDQNGFARVHVLAGDLTLAGLVSHPEGGANDLDDKHNAEHDSDEPTFHLKLDVQTFAGEHLFKHKVFWVGECTPVETTTTTIPATSTTVGASGSTTVPSTSPTTVPVTSTTVSELGSTTTVTSTTLPPPTTTVVPSTSTTSPNSTTTTTMVHTLGSTVTSTPTSTSAPGTVSVSPTSTTSLPRTGSDATLFGWFGVIVSLAGLTLLSLARRRG